MGLERFLIVDDSDANILFFEVLLGELGKTQIFSADNGTKGLQLAETHRVEFLIIAWEMEPMSGSVFIQKLRAARENSYLPCLIYSKKMSEGDVRLTREMGLENILSMPFDKEFARDLISKMIDSEESLTPQEKKLRKIEVLIEGEHYTQALQLFDGTMTRGAHRGRAKTLLADIYLRIGRMDRAESLAREAAEKDDYPPAFHLLANILSLLGRHDEAITLLEDITEKSPSNIIGLINLGNSYLGAERNEDAKRIFDKARKLDDENDQAREGLAKVAYQEGDLDKAAELLQATRNGDHMARFFNNLGISYVRAGKVEKGIETYENAIMLLANKTKLHLLRYNLGLAYRKANVLDKSFDNLAESYLLEPSFLKSYAAFVRLVKEMKGQGQSLDAERLEQVKAAYRDVQAASAEAS